MNTLHCDKFWAWFFAVFWWSFWKWRQVEMLRCQESIQDIIIYLHMKFRWNRTMLNLWGIVVAIFKMVTGRNFSMSGINSGHHNLPTYEMSLKSDNVEFVLYCGSHFENGDRWKLFNVGTSLCTHHYKVKRFWTDQFLC